MSEAKLARRIIETSTSASLGTLTESGSPFVSLVAIAATGTTKMVMLLSGLAKHTRNLNRSPGCSLLLVALNDESDNPLEGSRLTLVGAVRQLSRDEDADARSVFLARNPSSAMYAGFGDFAFYEFEVSEAHLVAGFGRIQTLSPQQLQS